MSIYVMFGSRPVDVSSMSHLRLVTGRQRAAFRLEMIDGEPVSLLLNIDGEDIDPVVDQLSAGGARLHCPMYFDRFEVGRIMGPATLLLQDQGRAVVRPVVKWKSFPVVGVEFLGIAEQEREMIFRFIFRLERKLLRMSRTERRKAPVVFRGSRARDFNSRN